MLPERNANISFGFCLAKLGHIRLMLMIPVIFALSILIAPAPAMAQDGTTVQENGTGSFRPVPLHQIAAEVSNRYYGRIISAEILPPWPSERMAGTLLVYEIRLVSPGNNLLQIRFDARNGRFLETRGRGQISARKRASATDAQ